LNSIENHRFKKFERNLENFVTGMQGSKITSKRKTVYCPPVVKVLKILLNKTCLQSIYHKGSEKTSDQLTGKLRTHYKTSKTPSDNIKIVCLSFLKVLNKLLPHYNNYKNPLTNFWVSFWLTQRFKNHQLLLNPFCYHQN